jgi:NADH:ubiquinone oxidoreductase subunit F (NADH-binding)/(2Fe-2S) ferredoxin/Pyruvate/2-oxoacid:ferredoxin oxidoreductase delta subunit
MRSRFSKEFGRFAKRVLVCSTGCRALGAAELGRAFTESVAAAGLADEVAVVETGCHGLCALAPIVLIEPQDWFYGGMKVEDVPEVVEQTLRKGEVVSRLCYHEDPASAPLTSIPFYANQTKQVLHRCGRIDPRSIEQAIARGAYAAAVKAIVSMTADQVIDEVARSGLRGRGGAGFPTAIKWRACRDAPGAPKYLICNADEGDPGAFMDRALLEGDPHSILEGMLIAARAIGASSGFIYVRAEYPIAVDHVRLAVDAARRYGLLGPGLLGTDMTFDIEVREGAGAFVCGEETALIASLEGHRGMPRPRPPFPVASGYNNAPTTINNVETFGNVPLVIEQGADAFASRGTAKSKGTKIFALAGKVQNTGLVEVPMGATLRQIVFDVGGGVPSGRTFKAAQTGGPSGGCVPAEFLDMPIDYDNLREVGAIMGSGGLIVMDDHTCMVDIARFFLRFVQKESCGKCAPCRVGTRKMLEILDRICEAEGREGDIDELERIGRTIVRSAMCGLGATAPNPVLSTIRYFREEYRAHIEDKCCPAVVCPILIRYRIDPVVCVGCETCRRVCPSNAIQGEKKRPHTVRGERCVRCGACFAVCPVQAVIKESRSPGLQEATV